MKTFGLIQTFLLAAAVGLIGCAKDAEPRACNANTLLVEFQCGQDLAAANKLAFRLARADEAGVDFETPLACPGQRRFEVKIPDYAAGQTFAVSATPLADAAPVGEANQLAGVALESGCTRVVFPLRMAGGVVMPEIDAMVSETPMDAGAVEERLDASTERGDKDKGAACGAASECQSGFCADGVCCESACTGACQACNLQGSMGSCLPTPAGQAPGEMKSCQVDPASSCGFDGTCDGAGACRKHPDGTLCAEGTCDRTGSRDRKVCSAGSCSAEKNLVCGSFLCDPAKVACFDECETDAQCDTGKACKLDPETNRKSCGKKLIGAACKVGGECETGFCADEVCCNQDCKGACLSCNQLNKVGECLPVPAGADDTRNICKATAAGMCGETGKCDGKGVCAKFAKGTVCAGATCAGNDGIPASECDGNGSCVPGKPVACAPNVCRGNACLDKCTTDADCTGGAVCTNNSCGLKPLGGTCKNGGECASGQCVDEVCCESACTGTCQYCAFPTSRGKCTEVPAGSDDPRDVCKAKDPNTCKENGRCNGNGACQLFAEATPCSEQSCNSTSNMLVYARQCDGLGTCKKVKEDTSCAPHTCSGNACADSCSRDDQCVAPNSCVSSLCGKRKPGQLCSNNDQCASGICTGEGVCCTTACSGTCKSCKVAGKEGTCSDVPSGQDPLNQCEAKTSSTCGTTGVCDGAGKCAVYDSGVICAGATCSGDKSKEIGASTCDGAGKCATPAGNTCANDLVCGGSSCKASCAEDADCRNGKKCNARTKQCALANGSGCANNAACGSDKCVDGYCCNADCSGACESCAAKDSGGTNGVCTALPSGASDAACPGASCSADKKTATPASTCDGARKCTTPTVKPCGEFTCNNGTCLETCTKDADCLDANKTCVGTQCKKKLGVACAAAGECGSGFCAPDGVCCNNACTGACQACGTGTCEPLSGSFPSECAPSACGFTGQCVSGVCQSVANGTSCGSATCKDGASQTAAPTCSNGQCVTPMATPCTPGTCKGSACSNACSADNGCASGAYCDSGGVCRAKKAQGASCGRVGECQTGNCAAGICCNSTCSGACQICSTGTCSNVSGAQGQGCTEFQRVCSSGSCVCASGRKDCNGLTSDGCECYEATRTVELRVTGRVIDQSRCKLTCIGNGNACLVEGNMGHPQYKSCSIACNIGSSYSICCSNGNSPCGGSFVTPWPTTGAVRSLDDIGQHTTTPSVATHACQLAPDYHLECSGTVPDFDFNARVVWVD
ncbi:MAG: hypothetical protein KA712_11590 [Myxococcales bacterium]|nr:hypothetical protein [Myxococcales bacterium]